LNFCKSRNFSLRRGSKNYGDINTYYEKFYRDVVGSNSSGVLSWLAAYPHRLLEAPFPSNEGLGVLEIGAGEHEHIRWVTKDFNKYVAVDIRDSLSLPKDVENYKFCKASVHNLPFRRNTWDRVVVTCLLLHLEDPEKALLEMRRVVKPGGIISLYVPPEPSLFLRLFRKLLIERKAARLGFKGYPLFCVRDHITYFVRIKILIEYLFRDSSIKVSYRPFFIPSWYVNGIVIFHIKLPITQN